LTFRVGVYPGFVENGILDCLFIKELRKMEDIIDMGVEFKAELEGDKLVVSVRVKQNRQMFVGVNKVKDNLFKFLKNNLVK